MPVGMLTAPLTLTFDTSSHIQGRVQISTELKQHKLGDEPQKGAEQIRIVHKVQFFYRLICHLSIRSFGPADVLPFRF